MVVETATGDNHVQLCKGRVPKVPRCCFGEGTKEGWGREALAGHLTSHFFLFS